MLVWEMQIVNLSLEMEKFDQLMDAGWEPFHFVLIPAPATNPILIGGKNGEVSPSGLTMINVVGLRHQIETEATGMSDSDRGLGDVLPTWGPNAS